MYYFHHDDHLFSLQVYRHGNRSPTHIYPNDPYKEDVWPQGLGMLTQVSLICYNIHLKYFDDTLIQCMDSSPGEFSTGMYRYYITNIF